MSNTVPSNTATVFLNNNWEKTTSSSVYGAYLDAVTNTGRTLRDLLEKGKEGEKKTQKKREKEAHAVPGCHLVRCHVSLSVCLSGTLLTVIKPGQRRTTTITMQPPFLMLIMRLCTPSPAPPVHHPAHISTLLALLLRPFFLLSLSSLCLPKPCLIFAPCAFIHLDTLRAAPASQLFTHTGSGI